jgi:hypothetical protein
LQTVSIAISAVALIISSITAWLTLLRRGTIKMTRPTVIFFGPDSGKEEDQNPKVYLRTLLFCTSKMGRVIESMHVALTRNESRQNFSVWVYGEERLVRGSGLFITDTGLVANHHFLMPRDQTPFGFLEGDYRLEVFGQLLGEKRTILLFSQKLNIEHSFAKELQEPGTGIYFDWAPDSSRYIAHIERKPPASLPKDMLQMLGLVDLAHAKHLG